MPFTPSRAAAPSAPHKLARAVALAPDGALYVMERQGSSIRVIRDGIVEYPRGEGQAAELGSLKRFKDEVKEVVVGQECGMAFENYQDIQKGDQIECFEVETIKRTL